MTWHIEVDGNGDPVGHVNHSEDWTGLTAPKADKHWFRPATMTDPAFDPATQKRSGPVYDLALATITYTVTDKTAQELDDEADEIAGTTLAGPLAKAVRDALWELHEAIRGEVTLPDETKNAYSIRIKDFVKEYL